MSAHPIARRALVGTVASAAVVAAVLLPVAAASAAPRPQAASAASRPQAASAVTFTWHKLALLNGWHAFGNGDAVPGYAISGGVVYLRGAMSRPAGSSTKDFAVLPTAARPRHNLSLLAYTGKITTGALRIAPNGQMQMTSDISGDAFAFTSLSGQSYPVSGFTWHKLTLINGWTSGQGAYGTGDPAYAIKNGVVYLSGSLIQKKGTNNQFAVLPKAARPVHNMFVMDSSAAPVGWLNIVATGNVYASGHTQPEAQAFTSLAGISWPTTAAKWHKLSLINGWKSGATLGVPGDPAYTVIRGVVYLSGGLVQPTGSNPEFAVLPMAARPAHDLQIVEFTSAGSGGFGATPHGAAVSDSFFQSNAQQFTALAPLSYPRTS